MARSLIWFRSDLRTKDNPALIEACRKGDEGVVAVFLPAFTQWAEHDWGPNKVDFILRQLPPLRDALAEMNIPLKIADATRFSDAPAALLKLARACKITHVFWNQEYEVNESERDEAVTQKLEGAGMEVRCEHDQTVIPPAVIKTQQGAFYSVYSPYKKAWLNQIEEGWSWQPRQRPRAVAPIDVESDPLPELPADQVERLGADVRRTWPAGEEKALDRLGRFVREKADDYKNDRDYPALDATSGISPYLAAGVVTPRQCLASIARHHGENFKKLASGPGHWVSEVIWREFYRHVLVGFPRVSRNRTFRLGMDRIPWREDQKALEAWKEGRTGVPIVDAAMRQLKTIGWMHNRLRMVAAMYLSKDLFLHWQEGERHFMNHLVDGDLASNNGGWQWSASTGTDAAPYFRIFNPISQSKRFDADGSFIRKYVPELADVEGDAIHDPAKIPALLRSSLDYPEPIRDHAQAREHVLKVFKNLDTRAASES